MQNDAATKSAGLAGSRVANVAGLVGYQEGAVVSREIM